MNKKAFALLGAVGTAFSPMAVLAEDYVYWEDIPSGEENQYINAGEETIIDAYKDLKEDEANALKVSLESTYTKVILKSYDVKTGETTKSLEMKFDSYEKASGYIKDLEDKGIVVENISFVNDTEDEEGSLEKTYSTLEEAVSALEEFKNEFSENLESEIIENKTDEVIESTESSESYKTYEEAKKALNDFLSDEENETDAFYFTGEVLGPKGTGEYTKSDINESFNSKEEALSYLEELKENGYTVLDYEFTFDTEKEEGSLEKTYGTEEEANNALEDFKNEYNEDVEDEIIENKTDKIIESIEGDKAYKTYEEAEQALNDFLSNPENETDEFYFSGEVLGPKGTGEYTQSKIEEKFNDEESAKAYIKELEEKGYIILDYEFVNDTEKEEGSLEKTCETEEEANKALEDFKNKYNEDVESNISKEYDESGNIEDSKYTTDEYLTEEEVNNAIKNETDKSDENYLIVGTVSSKTSTSSIESKVFDTKEEAQAYINSIKAQGYDISGIKQEILHYQDGYWVTEYGVKIEESKMGNEVFKYGHFDVTIKNTFTRVDLDGTTTTVTGKMTITNVTIDGKTIRMSGPSLDMNTGLYEYTSVERNDLNVTNSTYAKIEGYLTLSDGSKLPFVSEGYLNEDNNVCGGKNFGNNSRFFGRGFDIEFGEIKIVENKVYVLSNLTQKYYVSGNKSQTVYKGELTKYIKDYDYKVTAKGKKTVTKASGTLVGNKKIENQGYYYKLDKKAKTYTVKAKGKKTVTQESGKLTGNKEIENQGYYYKLDKKAKTYTVKAKGSKTITKDSGTLSIDTKEDVIETLYSIDLVKQKYTFFGGMGGDEPVVPTNDNGIEGYSVDEDIVNPQTGDESLWVFTAGGFSMIGLAATAYFINKERNN